MKICVSLLLSALLLMASAALVPAAPLGAVITDVCSRSFSAAWIAGEPATGSVSVFFDPDGTQAVPGAVLTSQPVLDPAGGAGVKAALSGVLKVRVAGLSPDTTYYFQAATRFASGPSVLHPSGPPFPSVHTAGEPSPADLGGRNDLVAVMVEAQNGEPVISGLAVLTLEGAAYPVSAFVGDAVHAPWAVLDLNNLSARAFGAPLSLGGGETVSVSFLSANGFFKAPARRVFDQSRLAAVQENLPLFGDLNGSGDLSLADAVLSLTVISGLPASPLPVQGISSPPPRGLTETLYVLRRLAADGAP